MRSLGAISAAFILCQMAYGASVEAEEISLECIPDPSSYSLTGIQKEGRMVLGPKQMLRPFGFYIPNGSQVAFYIYPDGSMGEFRAVITPLNIKVSKLDNQTTPFSDWYIDRSSGRYREELSWIRYKESTSGICRRQQPPTNRKF